jgi:hypothetical protein
MTIGSHSPTEPTKRGRTINAREYTVAISRTIVRLVRGKGRGVHGARVELSERAVVR